MAKLWKLNGNEGSVVLPSFDFNACLENLHKYRLSFLHLSSRSFLLLDFDDSIKNLNDTIFHRTMPSFLCTNSTESRPNN